MNVVETCSYSERTCEAVFKTDGKTCDSHCQSMGLVCEMGWDESSETCDSRAADDARRIGNGCGMSYGFQICRCSVGNSKSMRIFLITNNYSKYLITTSELHLNI